MTDDARRKLPWWYLKKWHCCAGYNRASANLQGFFTLRQHSGASVRRLLCLGVIAAGFHVLVGAAHAQDNPWEKFSIAVGGFLTESDTRIQINSKNLGVGAIVDLENVLGVERSYSTYRVDA